MGQIAKTWGGEGEMDMDATRGTILRHGHNTTMRVMRIMKMMT